MDQNIANNRINNALDLINDLPAPIPRLNQEVQTNQVNAKQILNKFKAQVKNSKDKPWLEYEQNIINYSAYKNFNEMKMKDILQSIRKNQVQY